MADTQDLTVRARLAGEPVGEAKPDRSSMSGSIPEPIISKNLYQNVLAIDARYMASSGTYG